MQPKLAVITVTGCHLIPVICVRRELADLTAILNDTGTYKAPWIP